MSLYKNDFKTFEKYKDLVYLDSGATSLKPQYVVDAIDDYNVNYNGSPHRGAHKLSVESTRIYNESREGVRAFIGAKQVNEIVFTRNATESLNMIAYSYVKSNLKAHQNIVISITNHHSNILPFQKMVNEIGAELRYLYCDDEGKILEEELSKIDRNTLLVSIPYISNGLGIRHDIKRIFKKADEFGVIKLLDAAQGIGHEHINVIELDVDLMVFSGHKIFAPQGIGVLYGKFSLLDKFEPFLLGGDMIEYVEEQISTFAELPERLEAGTQNVLGAYGLLKAIEYIEKIGLDNIKDIEEKVVDYAYSALSNMDFIKVYGPKNITDRGQLITFNVSNVHPHDVSTILDNANIAIRAGHHCCQPLMKYMKTASTCRASFSVFNTKADVDALVIALYEVKEVFGIE